jgi:hypothetical protein
MIPKFLSLGCSGLLSLGLLMFISPGQARAQSEPPATLSGFPAESVDDVVVPVPSEIFNVLDKMGEPNWREEYRPTTGRNSGNRAQVALLLGTVIADGFVAVEAEDAEKVKEIGRDVLNLAEAINVRDAVIARAKGITDKAERRRWDEARQEFDGALQDVRAAMRELNDDDLAQLVSLGGWIRGTQVLTSIVKSDFDPKRAELLHQPDLIAYFQRRLDAMPERLREDAVVKQIHQTLPKILPLVGKKDGKSITKEQVESIHQMSSELIVTIAAEPS